MGLVFYLTFNVIGLFFQNLMETGIDALTGIVDTALTNWNVNAAVHSLLIDGIFTGVGSVLSFLPIIVVLFFFLSMLEDTGYMARVAFVMDKLLRRIGPKKGCRKNTAAGLSLSGKKMFLTVFFSYIF